MEHKYILQKYTNRSSRHTCPSCGEKHCFTLYLDAETYDPVSPICGRCDHEQSCGYNYTPFQFYRDRPWMKDKKKNTLPPIRKMPPPRLKAPYLPFKYVQQRMSVDNAFFDWISSLDIIDWDRLNNVCTLYLIGSTEKGKYTENAIIFWQVDINGNVHDGKLMWYKKDGHRQKWMSWVSSKLKAAKMFPDISTDKCFFGEHLLTGNHYPVAIVESEKSAIFCSCLFPEYIWIASCGCGGLNEEKMQVLHDRDIVVFPDSGEADKWQVKLDKSGVPYRMIRDFENYPANTDIVDIILDDKKQISTIKNLLKL